MYSLNVFIIALIGALFFQFVHLPMPWLLGAFIFVLLSQFIYKDKLKWSPIMRDIGLIMVGISIGQQFELHLFANLTSFIGYLLLINILLIVFAVVLSLLMQRFGKMNFKTALISSIPGGLSQFVMFAEDDKDINLAVVTFFHVVRVICVVLFIPFLISGQVVDGGGYGIIWNVELIYIFILCIFATWIGKKIRLPVYPFLAPVCLVILLKIGGLPIDEVPHPVLYLAQVFIGAHIGLMLKPSMLRLPRGTFIAGFINAFCLIGFSYIISIILMKSLNYTFPTSFLSTAPGGLDQMGLLATGVGGDVSVVTAFQLFRILFIFLIVLPIIRKYFTTSST